MCLDSSILQNSIVRKHETFCRKVACCWGSQSRNACRVKAAPFTWDSVSWDEGLGTCISTLASSHSIEASSTQLVLSVALCNPKTPIVMTNVISTLETQTRKCLGTEELHFYIGEMF